jgi:Na+/H+ antiporter NhaC
MKEKFYANLSIVLPAAIAALVIYLLGNQVDSYALAAQGGDIIKALPYLLVIILALCGVNVLVVLVLGIVVAALLGLVSANIDLLTIYTSAGEGLDSMCELILVTILAGGIMGVVKQLGGFDYLIERLTSIVRSRRGAEGVIALLTALTNIFTANNTIAILTVAPIARDLSKSFDIPARKSASLMDTASCFVQGFLPYGAQLLMAAGLAAVSPIDIILHLYYPFLTGVMVVFAIIFQIPRR